MEEEKMKAKGFFLWSAAMVALMVGFWTQVEGASFPDRPITYIVNYTAGGITDLSARALCKAAGDVLGQPIIVVNKVGASGTLGLGAIAASKPDGYTIGTTTFGPLTQGPNSFDVPYNPLTDFEYISIFGKNLYCLGALPNSPFKTLKDLTTYAKANPGKVKYATLGVASPENLAMIQLAKAAGVKWEMVTFKGSPEAMSAVLGGHVDLIAQVAATMVPYVEGKRLRLLVSFSDVGLERVPDVPTVRELGYPFDVTSWMALGAPKGVPAPIMEKLRSAFKVAVKNPDFLRLMKESNCALDNRTPEEYEKFVREGYKSTEELFLELGIHKSQMKGK
jgi:tripartite-type tricarboxylate transporter receptor subunit TctC